MKLSHLAPALAAGILGSFLATPNARACTAPACVDGAALPQTGGALPKSAPAIPLSPGRNALPDGGTATFTLTKVGGATVPFTLDTSKGNIVPLVPSAPLEEGASYRIDAENGCTGGKITLTTFQATADAAIPARLGTLTLGAPAITDVTVYSPGECQTTISAATATVDLALSDAAKPWKDVLVYTTLVDGKPWQPSHGPKSSGAEPRGPIGGSWEGRGKDLLYVACGDAGSAVDRGLAEGTHKVQMQAAIVGSDKVVVSDEQTVTLRCNAEPGDAGSDGGADASPDGSTPDGGRPDLGNDTVTSDGGCSASPGGPTSASALFGGAIAALAFMARRRRSVRA